MFIVYCLLFILPLILVNLYFVNYIFWQIRGYEVIELTAKALSITRKGKLFKDSSIIPMYAIEKIEENKKYAPTKFGNSIWRNPFLISKIVGEEGGRIRVIYNTKIIGFRLKIAIDFGQGLSKEEAYLYVKQMNEIVCRTE